MISVDTGPMVFKIYLGARKKFGEQNVQLSFGTIINFVKTAAVKAILYLGT